MNHNNHRAPTILNFFLTKIIIGIAVIAGSVALSELSFRLVLESTGLNENPKNIIIAFADVGIALASYVGLFRWYDKRDITELSLSKFRKEAFVGFAAGLMLQSLFVAVIYLAGTYSVTAINPLSSLALPFTTSFTAGFVAVIIIVGIVFRLLEERFGTPISLFAMVLIFALLHAFSKNATLLSVCSTAAQAGFMLPAAYVFDRSLWLPIFLHFSWDFAEPGVYGGINPGNSITVSLFSSEINGPPLITGGLNGPQNSIQALALCVITGLLLLKAARRKSELGLRD